MRRNRRNGHVGLEFGGSGEDSFVAVVVTKLTGALLFILLLTMVIMALIPKGVDAPAGDAEADKPRPLAVVTPNALPEAIAGHPYTLALAATGGKSPLNWSVVGLLPEGLALDPESGVLRGTPAAGTPKPLELILQVSDGVSSASQLTRLTVYQSDKPLTTPAWWKPGIPPIPVRAWLEQGFGFLLLWLVHLVGMNTVASLHRWSLGTLDAENAPEEDRRTALKRFAVYRLTIRVTTLAAAITLATWLLRHHN